MDEVKFNSIMPHRKHSGRDGLSLHSSTLVLTENLINPDGSRARTKVTLLNGLVSLLGQD